MARKVSYSYQPANELLAQCQSRNDALGKRIHDFIMEKTFPTLRGGDRVTEKRLFRPLAWKLCPPLLKFMKLLQRRGDSFDSRAKFFEREFFRYAFESCVDVAERADVLEMGLRVAKSLIEVFERICHGYMNMSGVIGQLYRILVNKGLRYGPDRLRLELKFRKTLTVKRFFKFCRVDLPNDSIDDFGIDLCTCIQSDKVRRLGYDFGLRIGEMIYDISKADFYAKSPPGTPFDSRDGAPYLSRYQKNLEEGLELCSRSGSDGVLLRGLMWDDEMPRVLFVAALEGLRSRCAKYMAQLKIDAGGLVDVQEEAEADFSDFEAFG